MRGHARRAARGGLSRSGPQPWPVGSIVEVASLRVAMCQLDVTVGDLEANAEKVIAQLAEAEAAGADLAVFPELVLTGYPP